MKIYTKTGDKGETGLFKGPRVPKHNFRVEAYGDVDELNAVIGTLLVHINDEGVRELLEPIQHELFEVGADLATPLQEPDDPRLRIKEEFTNRLEKHIDKVEGRLPELKYFILPGGSPGGAMLHLARTVCRRAERSVTRLQEVDAINPEIIRYLNRLSDLLFVLARAENQANGKPEIPWQRKNK
jgi:cob(I)alamin adenosyltransferase